MVAVELLHQSKPPAGGGGAIQPQQWVASYLAQPLQHIQGLGRQQQRPLSDYTVDTYMSASCAPQRTKQDIAKAKEYICNMYFEVRIIGIVMVSKVRTRPGCS